MWYIRVNLTSDANRLWLAGSILKHRAEKQHINLEFQPFYIIEVNSDAELSKQNQISQNYLTE